MGSGWREGLRSAGLTAEPAGAVFPKEELDLGGRGSLAGLSGELAFFTPGIAYVHGGLTDFLWFELSRELGHDVPLYFWRGGSQLVAGLELPDGDDDWNFALWAAPRMYWPVVLDFVASVVFYDRRRDTACGFGVQELLLQDVLACPGQPLDRRSMPVVVATGFGVNGSDRRVAFDPPDARKGVPRAGRFGPAPDMVRFARATAKGGVATPADLAKEEARERQD